jgi:hypothetical protein
VSHVSLGTQCADELRAVHALAVVPPGSSLSAHSMC